MSVKWKRQVFRALTLSELSTSRWRDVYRDIFMLVALNELLGFGQVQIQMALCVCCNASRNDLKTLPKWPFVVWIGCRFRSHRIDRRECVSKNKTIFINKHYRILLNIIVKLRSTCADRLCCQRTFTWIKSAQLKSPYHKVCIMFVCLHCIALHCWSCKVSLTMARNHKINDNRPAFGSARIMPI